MSKLAGHATSRCYTVLPANFDTLIRCFGEVAGLGLLAWRTSRSTLERDPRIFGFQPGGRQIVAHGVSRG